MLRLFMKPYLKENIVILVLTFIMALIQTVSAVLHTFATDALIQGKFRYFLSWNAISLAMWALLFILNYYCSTYEEKVIQQISTDIREHIARKVSIASYQNVTQHSEGTYTSWLNNDIKYIQDNGLRQYYAFWGHLFSVILAVIALITYHYSLVLATFLLMGLLILFPSLFEKKMGKATETLAKENEKFVSSIQDTISGYDSFFSANQIGKMVSRIVSVSRQVGKGNVQYVKSMKKSEGFIGIVNVLSQVGIVTFTGVLAYFKFVTIGALSSTGSLASAIFNAISQGSQSRLMYKTVDVFFRKYDEFESNKGEVCNILSDVQVMELRQIHYEINGKSILNNVNYVFEKGKKYAIVGESGSGKSTLLNILAGKITNYEGEILVNGQLIQNSLSLKVHLAYVPQQVYLLSDSVKNNIGLWREVADARIEHIYQQLELDSFLTLDTCIQEGGKNLSGGQRQRIAFARALVGTETIYLLDESTANLDKDTAIWLENQLLNDSEATVIMVTHRLFDENRHKFDDIIELTKQ